jgi:hypothetical protein
VALVRTDVSEEPSSSIIRVTRIGELGTMLAAQHASVGSYGYGPSSSILVTLTNVALGSSGTSVLTRAHRVTPQKTAFFRVTAVKPQILQVYKKLKRSPFCLRICVPHLTLLGNGSGNTTP